MPDTKTNSNTTPNLLSLGSGSGAVGSIASAFSSVFATGVQAFSGKVRDNNLAIAQANAETARANAEASKNVNTTDPKIIYGVIGVVAVLMIVFFISKSK
jgi:hypothetical protein